MPFPFIRPIKGTATTGPAEPVPGAPTTTSTPPATAGHDTAGKAPGPDDLTTGRP